MSSSSSTTPPQILPSLQPGYKYWSFDDVQLYLKRSKATCNEALLFTKGTVSNPKDNQCYLAVPENLFIPELVIERVQHQS